MHLANYKILLITNVDENKISSLVTTKFLVSYAQQLPALLLRAYWSNLGGFMKQLLAWGVS